MFFSFIIRVISITVFSGFIFVENASFQTDMVYIKKCNHTSPISLSEFLPKKFTKLYLIFHTGTINEVLINKKLSNQNEVDSFMCFMHCLFMMYGWMDEEGGFNLHLIKTELDGAQVQIDTVELVLYKCTAIQSVDRCERAFEFLKCFWETMEEVIITIIIN